MELLCSCQTEKLVYRSCVALFDFQSRIWRSFRESVFCFFTTSFKLTNKWSNTASQRVEKSSNTLDDRPYQATNKQPRMPPGFKRSRAIWDEARSRGGIAWVHAIVYELQPIRLSKSSRKEALATLRSFLRNSITIIAGIPTVVKSIFIFISNRSLRQWMIVGAIVAYYWFIRWIHEWVVVKFLLSFLNVCIPSSGLVNSLLTPRKLT